MHDGVTLKEAQNRLYRREINAESSDKPYVHSGVAQSQSGSGTHSVPERRS